MNACTSIYNLNLPSQNKLIPCPAFSRAGQAVIHCNVESQLYSAGRRMGLTSVYVSSWALLIFPPVGSCDGSSWRWSTRAEDDISWGSRSWSLSEASIPMIQRGSQPFITFFFHFLHGKSSRATWHSIPTLVRHPSDHDPRGTPSLYLPKSSALLESSFLNLIFHLK